MQLRTLAIGSWREFGFATRVAAIAVLLGVLAEHFLGFNDVATMLEQFGAVSQEVVTAMVRGALSRSRANVACSITGIAGPSGAVPGKPVGTVWLAWGRGHHPPLARRFLFEGDRDAVRRQTVRAAFIGLTELIAH